MSKPIDIYSKERCFNSTNKPSKLVNINLDVDLDTFTEEDILFMEEKTQSLSKTISDSQISTQMNVTSFCGYDRLEKFEKVNNNYLNSDKIKGKQLYVPRSIRNIKITGDERNAYVLTEIKNTTLFNFQSPVTHMVITNCKGIVIRVGGKLIAGIECINSSDIIIECDSHSFVRTTTSNSCKITGKTNNDTLIDVRNCFDIYFNNERIETNIFTEGRFKGENGKKGGLRRVPSSEDLLHKPFPNSMPNMTFMKKW